MIQKLKKFWFLLTTIVVLMQTAVTFGFLYYKSESPVLGSVIMVFAAGYILAFLVLCVMSAHSHRYSREAMHRFKTSQKAVRRILNLIMLAMNIVFIINSKSGFVLAPIVMVIFNFLLIVIDFKMAEIAEKRERRRKQKRREKEMAEKEAYNPNKNEEDDGNYKKHKKRRFFADFSRRRKKEDENE